MKILIINNFNSENRLGGVEHYLHELIQYAEKNNSDYIFKWFGKDKIKTNWVEKIYHKTITQEIIREIESFQPDVIHCFSIGAPVTPHFMEFAKSKGIPIVFSFRDYYYICPKNYMLNDKNEVLHKHESALECILHHQPKRNILFDTLLYLKQSHHKSIIKKHIDYFLTPSENLTQFVSKHFKKEGKTLANPILIEQNQNSNSEGNYIMFVGRLVPEKGILTLLKAFQNISKQFPNEKLWIVGDGNQIEELQIFIENNELKNVSFLGNKSREELHKIYANSKFSVVPSEYLEAYGNVILESLAFGKTVITSDLVGIKNEIEQYNVGLTYSFKNQEALEEKMVELLSNSGLKSELENNIPNYLVTKTFAKHFSDLVNVYENLLSRNR
ncbi:glycosyltransferase family 4 protein [Flavobacterium cheniae]|uniref:Glycosyltransferase involved in cell wall biosynthesis n=1 Tax=Flavobacterium cheniae TaxID=295428 RepID=A0A562KP16_9FLAO|nr:glycosyltransferase family 4 protein [Flavobacterium cheniae]TDR23125.1 glycosyltransferase involved in cell wall biosynthesis [Flavobacterium cheniae]TWH97015.1 glycosyltransferase involved in cell wall biosynthesis [Flavobacterium cheniae]